MRDSGLALRRAILQRRAAGRPDLVRRLVLPPRPGQGESQTDHFTV